MTFRILYRPRLGAPTQFALVEAPDRAAAEARLREQYEVRNIRAVTIRCEGTVTQEHGHKRLGYEPVVHRCYRFSQGRLCPAHSKKGG